MPLIMKPQTLGCENGFREVFYDSNKPDSQSEGNSFCYKSRLAEEERKDLKIIQRCSAMKKGECWKIG